MVEKLTFGSDPEFFFLENGHIIPPVFLLGEGKDIKWKSGFPYRIYETFDEISVTSDGAAFELTVSPKEDWEQLFDLISQGIVLTENLVKRNDLKLGVVPAARIGTSYLVEETLVTGCDPDYDALDSEWFCKDTVEESPYRYAGAHLHIGFQDKDMREYAHKNIVPLVQLLSLYVGVPALINSSEREREAIRLKKYGKPAKYRIPEHGVEYRSPSNNWIINKNLAGVLFENVQKVVEIFKNPEKGGKILEEFLMFVGEGFKNEDFDTLEAVYNDAIKLI